MLELLFAVAAGLLQWETDWKTAFERAQRENKAVLIEFSATKCPDCKRMERTFGNKEVARQLAGFVLLRIVDEHDPEPQYSIRTPSDHTLITLHGYFEAREFREKLELIQKQLPALLAAVDALQREETIANTMQLGILLDRAGAHSQAREAYLEAADLAAKQEDSRAVQVALVEAAVARIKMGGVEEGIADLHVYAAAPYDAECDAAIWLGIGFGEEQRRNNFAARKAYRKARERAPAGTLIRQQAEKRLSGLK